MATEIQTGMERGEMKRFLTRSKQEPVNCAIGVGDDKSMALLLLSPTRSAKSLQGDLQKQFPSVFNTRIGTAMVDTDDDPTLVKFMLNRAVTSMARRLVKTLKGTGFRKVQILLEDGTPVEAAIEEEASGQAGVGAGDARPVAEPQPDPTALVQALSALVRRIPDVADPALRDALASRARAANADIKLGNLVYAATGIDQLRSALDKISASSRKEQPETPGAPPNPTASPLPSAAPTPSTEPEATAAQSANAGGDPRAIWREAKEAVDDKLNALASQLRAKHHQDMDRIADLGLFSLGKNENVGMNRALLEFASASAEKRGAAKQQLGQAIAAYRAMLSQSQAIKLLAATPFGVAIPFQATLGGALDQIERTLR